MSGEDPMEEERKENGYKYFYKNVLRGVYCFINGRGKADGLHCQQYHADHVFTGYGGGQREPR